MAATRRAPSELTRLWWVLARGRCPACGEGDVRAGALTIAEICPACGRRLRTPGSHYGGPMLFGYVLGIGFALALGGGLWLRFGAFRGIEWIMGLSSMPAAWLGYRWGQRRLDLAAALVGAHRRG